jgi:hypothetical protein
MAAILIENVSLLSHKVQIAAAPNEQGRRGRDRMVVGFYNYLCNLCLSSLKL